MGCVHPGLMGAHKFYDMVFFFIIIIMPVISSANVYVETPFFVFSMQKGEGRGSRNGFAHERDCSSTYSLKTNYNRKSLDGKTADAHSNRFGHGRE
jgi:hypothetical protein